MSFESVTGTVRYEIEHTDSEFKVELFELSNDPHDRQRFASRVEQTLQGRRVHVATAEDTLVMKIRWFARARRAKDRDDIVNVLAVQAGQLDLEYIRSWCDQHQTREAFEKLLAEASAT